LIQVVRVQVADRRSQVAGVLLLVFSACASAPPPPTQPPAWTQVPSSLLDTVCAKLQEEGITVDNLAVAKTTQPLVTAASLRAVAHLYGKDADVASLAQLYTKALQPLPLALTDSRCAWRPIAKLDPIRDHDQMVVELSAPIPNPFMHNEAGVLARMSLGGHDSQWYWIPLGQKKGQWGIGIVLPMDLHE
jgi:hypothetical protein